jgi:transcriptional regulator with XRE-family HTH domain
MSQANLQPRAGAPGAESRRSVRLGTFLRRLREGYGYTLRKVEERAIAFGEVIDNSQLSRFEKGKAIPSFEKLRALAAVFNVPVQHFSDVLDLEEYEGLKPQTGGYDEMLASGAAAFAAGEHGRAFVTFERALELAQQESAHPTAAERIVEARWRMAVASKALGKLFLTEHELREVLKDAGLTPSSHVRVLLQLLLVYREQGDLYLARVLARECLELARHERDLASQAAVHNVLGNIHHHVGDLQPGLLHYTRAAELLDELGPEAMQDEMRLTVLTNRGGCLVALQRFEEGVACIREAQVQAAARGYRRVAALALTRLGEAHLGRGDREEARHAFQESDALASREDDSYPDVLFLNAFRRWEMAREEGHGTRERIAFGRLRHLRPRLERRFPEVEAFDRHVERTRRSHALPA